MRSSKALYSLGSFLLFVGVISAMLLNVTLLVASVEAFLTFKDEAVLKPDRMKNVHCPLMTGKEQTVDLKVTLHNPKHTVMENMLVVKIASHDKTIPEYVPVHIEPGHDQSLVITAGPEDVLYQRMILVSFFLPGALDSSLMAICPITVLPWNVNGSLVLYLWVGATLVFILSGLTLWLKNQGAGSALKSGMGWGMITLAVMVLIGLAAVPAGFWGVAVASVSVTLLLFILMGSYMVRDS